MKDSKKSPRKVSDSESESGEGPSAATQESRSCRWHCSQGACRPLLGSWRKEKQFPGAGSNRNTTPPEEPRRKALNQTKPGFFRDLTGPSRHHTQALTAHGDASPALLATIGYTLRLYYVNPGKATSLQGCLGEGWAISGSHTNFSAHFSSLTSTPAPSQS